MYSFSVREHPMGGWYWVFAAEGGRGVVAQSTPYDSPEACENAIRILQQYAQFAQLPKRKS